MSGKAYFIDLTNRDGVQTYGGIKDFRHVYDTLGIHFSKDNEARKLLELVQQANLYHRER